MVGIGVVIELVVVVEVVVAAVKDGCGVDLDTCISAKRCEGPEINSRMLVSQYFLYSSVQKSSDNGINKPKRSDRANKVNFIRDTP